MARSLIIILAALPIMAASCDTLNQRLDEASHAEGRARAEIPPVTTPGSCTAKMERVYPRAGEKARWTQRRWEIVADNRDQLAEDCGAALDEYWRALKRTGPQ